MARCSYQTTTRARSIGSVTKNNWRGASPPSRFLPPGFGCAGEARARTRLNFARGPIVTRAWLRCLFALVVATSAFVMGTRAGAADLEAGRKKAAPCAACHGPDGNATIPGTPSLAGQPDYFTHWQLIKFRDGRRKDPQMSPFAQNLSDADMADLAAYYEAQ